VIVESYLRESSVEVLGVGIRTSVGPSRRPSSICPASCASTTSDRHSQLLSCLHCNAIPAAAGAKQKYIPWPSSGSARSNSVFCSAQARSARLGELPNTLSTGGNPYINVWQDDLRTEAQPAGLTAPQNPQQWQMAGEASRSLHGTEVGRHLRQRGCRIQHTLHVLS